eukprot:1014071-Amphidinium_carterae.1
MKFTGAPHIGPILRCKSISEDLCYEVRGRLPPQRGKSQSRLSGRGRRPWLSDTGMNRPQQMHVHSKHREANDVKSHMFAPLVLLYCFSERARRL